MKRGEKGKCPKVRERESLEEDVKAGQCGQSLEWGRETAKEEVILDNSTRARSRRSLCATGGQTPVEFPVGGLGTKSDLCLRTAALAGG